MTDMPLSLRPYQRAAFNAAMGEIKKSTEPFIIDAAPAAGKSYIVAALSYTLRNISGGKRVLCLQPNSKLVSQNYEKFLLTGEKASIFSASAGTKSTRQGVVFATPLTVKNSIGRFTRGGADGYCAVIVDEAHEITPTIQEIIAKMREANPNLRVVGLTGTPFRLGTGYIFRMWPDNRVNGDDTCRDPYFVKCVYRVSAREMLDQKFITPMEVLPINAAEYDTSGIVLLPNGSLNHSTVERAFEGHGRATAAIVADVIAQANAKGVKGGIMYFAATVKHAEEILASLPQGNSGMTCGDKNILFGKEVKDKEVIAAYRNKKFKHLVSVGKLTTGFDVSHTEVIAILRYTESAALLQQILGRAWRLDDAKPVSYLLDYAGNVERHFPDGDIYNPDIRASGSGSGSFPIEVHCPDCGNVNEFSMNPDYAEYQYDQHGYAIDAFGEQLQSEYGPVPVHYGRRCFGVVSIGGGKYDRCNYRWTGKDCEACGEKNDIAARYCYVCKAEIVDPNDKLITKFKALKKDPTLPQTDRVISVSQSLGISSKGNETLRVDFVTEYRNFSIWLLPNSQNPKNIAEYGKWLATGGKPETVSYAKEPNSNFYRVFAYNKEPDDEGLPSKANDDKQIIRMKKTDGAKKAMRQLQTKAQRQESDERLEHMKRLFG